MSEMEEFIKNFLLDFLLKFDEIKRGGASISDLFDPDGIKLSDLEYISGENRFKQFMEVTNENIQDGEKVDLGFIKYRIFLKTRKFSKSINVLLVDGLILSLKRFLAARLDNKHKLDGISGDILDYAVAAPMSARLLKTNMFKVELRNVPIGQVEAYLDSLMRLGYLKRKGVSNQYVLKE